MTRLDGSRIERRYEGWLNTGEAIGRVLRRLMDKYHDNDRRTDTGRPLSSDLVLVRVEYATQERRPRNRMR